MWGRPKSTVMIVANQASTPSLRPGFLDEARLQMVDLDADCLQVAREARPGLIIEDVDADDTQRCLDLCQQLKTDPQTRGIPLVAVAFQGSEQQAREARADVVLRKPIVQSEYFDTICRYVRMPRRRENRHQINLRFQFEHDGRRGQAFSRDLSPYGAYLKTDFGVDVGEGGTTIRLHFRLPGDSREIHCLGDLRRAVPYRPGDAATAGFAVEFVKMDPRDLARMRAFLERGDRPV
ncbi:MAG: PilZ domain-containing protein [Acidobacteriota bacterium]|nr:PilZ domain-containing protein [Acidobacteriota bacterium]MDH3786225.1 PilZ domain-containing protein [Acidobacteriota bacterium]